MALSTQKRIFLNKLSTCCRVDLSAEAASIDRLTAYNWRRADPEFAEAWEQAMRDGLSALEDEVHRRAFDGVDDPLVHQGQFMYLRDFQAIDPETGKLYPPSEAPILRDKNGEPVKAAVKKHSDTLAMFLLKAHAPDKYRERMDMNLSGRLDIADAIHAARKRTGE